ncbi:MAG: sugar phosphate isomerase/epimerase family protein [Hominenteromicrobium sp.]
MMQTGISAASLYPMETEKALVHLSGLGYTLFEIFFNSCGEMSPDFCALLNRLQADHGFRIVSVHPFTSAMESMLLFERYDRRTKEGFDFYKKYMEAAERIGARILVLHGQRIGSGSLSDEAYYARYHELYRLGQTFGITVAQENVRQFRSSKTEFIRGMRRALGSECAFVLDTKQAVMSGVDPAAMCSAMGERLVHIHLSDHTKTESCLLPGEGTYDFRILRDSLAALGYAGDIITEVYRPAIRDDAALEASLSFVNRIFGEKMP